MNESLIGLINNVALLVVLALVFDTCVLKTAFQRMYFKILSGIVFGILGIVVMMTPWVVLPGLIIDTRSVLLSIGGLFFGMVPTLIAMLITCIFLFLQGGIGMLPGITLIISSGFLGIAWRARRHDKLNNMSIAELFLFGVVVHVVMLLWILLLPHNVSKNVLSTISLPVILLNPLGTILLGKLMLARLQRKKEADALLESESLWRSLTENSPDHIFTLDADLKILFSNTAAPGLKVNDLIGTSLPDHIEEEDKRAEVRNVLKKVLQTGKPQSYESVFHTPKGTAIYYESRVVSRSLGDSKEIVGLTISSRNITERKKVEDDLRESEMKYSTLFSSANQTIYIAQDGRLVFINPMAVKLTGYSESELLSRPFTDFIHPDDREMVIKRHIERMKGNSPPDSYIFRLVPRDGKIRWVELNTVPISWHDKPATLNFLSDTTDRKLAEEQIKKNLKEKELLLQEIHHRVKNNMQIIVSLLKLQRSKYEDEHIQNVLMENEGRIFAMSAIHESLYQSEHLSEIDIKEYLSNLTQTLLQTYSINSQEVTFHIESPPIKLDIDMAIPLSLVLNELISNALKHAFPDKRRGTINIVIEGMEETLVLTIMDNGIGMPGNLDWKNAETLGLKLVRTLIENQLSGSIGLDNRDGTRFIIQLPLNMAEGNEQ